jgi:hypothetical protein
MDTDMDTLGQVIARHATAVALEWGARITIFAVFVLLAGSTLQASIISARLTVPKRSVNFMFLSCF